METFTEKIERITPKHLRYRLQEILIDSVNVCMYCDHKEGNEKELHRFYESQGIKVTTGSCRMHTAKQLLSWGMHLEEIEKELTKLHEEPTL